MTTSKDVTIPKVIAGTIGALGVLVGGIVVIESTSRRSFSCDEYVAPPSTIGPGDTRNIVCVEVALGTTTSTTTGGTTTTSAGTTTTVAGTTTTTSGATTTTSGGTTTTTTGGIPGNIADPAGAYAANIVSTGGTPGDMSWEPSGNFRTFCDFSHIEYDDPIVFPGGHNASHLHMFFGNKLADADSTYSSLRSTGDSSCEGNVLNRTAYWMPAMLEQGTANVIIPEFFLIYYKGNSGRSGLSAKQAEIAGIPSYPNGLRMISGYNNTGATGNGASDRHEWYCANGGPKTSTIPTNCGTGNQLLVALPFPSCWDGVNLDSTSHRMHIVYGVRDPDTGVSECPGTHPIHLPELTEFAYFVDNGNTANWYLSSDAQYGTSPGASFHADWFGGWSNAAMDAWRTNCINAMRNCNSGDLGNGTKLIDYTPFTGGTVTAPDGWNYG